ncbi:hypothetical protein Y032_0889g2878 [Ancylostoma ceylanicum]|uniref:Uncharacterized protein n=1 Tax=Ancylostoma ceylanicum TaxID=53326 RepID=A0A016W9K9_9BILA|nr:hypothetical protein Y032_0889g2878 [Ancylostoma ceylanicum]
MERSERLIKIRKPSLEISSFSGNYREFNSFGTVFESLIHNDNELSDTDKFLFLKQVLEGKAAAALSCIPVIGDRYSMAVNILKEHFDRSANMADIIINENERLQRAFDNPRSCGETFEAINARIIHLEQTGMTVNADRIWRRLILSKFPEVICTMVIQKESQSDHSFDVTEIMSTIDAIWKPPINCNHRHQGDERNLQSMHSSQNERQIPTLDKTPTVSNQCVLQIATVMIFSEAEWDHQPITLLLDSRAQKSFIKSGISEELKLRITGSTSFTTSGMGELQGSFNSNDLQVTLKGLHSSKKLEKLSVHTEKKLTTPLTTAELSEEDLNFISSSNITVAQQSLASATVSANLLIGQDLLSTIRDHSSPVLTLPSGLILTPTVYGYTISGTSLTKEKTSADVHGSA